MLLASLRTRLNTSVRFAAVFSKPIGISTRITPAVARRHDVLQGAETLDGLYWLIEFYILFESISKETKCFHSTLRLLMINFRSTKGSLIFSTPWNDQLVLQNKNNEFGLKGTVPTLLKASTL